jgi:putative ATP-dependent endonuclease of OLD family
MYLEKLKVRNFRSFDDETIALTRGLTIFVGENNGGKSNAIDAIRVVTSPLSGRREIYCETTDIRFGSDQRRFEIESRFVGLSAAQQGRFMSVAADNTLQAAIFGVTYDETTGQYPVRPVSWGGQFKTTPEAGCADMIRHVYLPPLRDAKRALASGNPTRIYALLKHFLGDEDPDVLAQRLKRTANDPILNSVDGAVDVGLKELTSGVRRQTASLGFSNDEKLIDVARDLRFKLADHGIEPEDIRYSGHGYANLLYMATIAVELEKVSTSELTLFLVEEPEAHLHPQLQAAVLCFLEEQAEKSRQAKADANAPAGHLQVVVATHSPNLSAWVESKNLVFFRSTSIQPAAPAQPAPAEAVAVPAVAVEEAVAADSDAEGGAVVAPAAAPAPRRVSRTIPLGGLSLTDEQRRKIDRYIDVTKSALLFGGRVLLVEGIAEALLLPVIAKLFALRDQPENYRQFRASVFVPIDSVDFEPYVKLLLTPYSGVHIADRVVVITDGDRGDLPDGETTPGERRRDALTQLATDLTTATALDVFVNTYSLEPELVRAGNADLMKAVYLDLHPRSEEKWNAAIAKSDGEQAKAIQQLFESTRKGEFAHLLAERINNGAAFQVPAYLKDAIEALVK